MRSLFKPIKSISSLTSFVCYVLPQLALYMALAPEEKISYKAK